MTKIAINGLGRIGRATLRIILDTPALGLTAQMVREAVMIAKTD